MEENNEFLEKIVKIKNTVREFGPFTAVVDDELNLIIAASNGWRIVYPFGIDAWAFLMTWFESWDEMAQKCVENFIKGIVFPTSVRLNGADQEYMADIVNAHEALTKRQIERGEFEVPEEESDKENREDASNDNNEKTEPESEEKDE